MTIPRFGEYARLQCHIHILLADGLFQENGVFFVMPKIDIKPLAELFRANVLKMLKKEGRIDTGLIAKLLIWKHNSGFSVHDGVRLARDDEKGREALAQYINRNPFSVKKITYNVSTGTVIYKSKTSQRKYKGGRKKFFNWCDIMAGTRIAAGVSGRSTNMRLPLPTSLTCRLQWNSLTYPITGRRKSLHRSGGNAPQGHLLRGTSKRCGRLTRWHVRSVIAR